MKTKTLSERKLDLIVQIALLDDEKVIRRIEKLLKELKKNPPSINEKESNND